MAFNQNPANFFIGTLVNSEQKFLKTLLVNARKAGYSKFIEPCAGAFAMSHLAVQAGYSPQNIQASDVMLMTTVMGYASMGQPIDEFQIRAKGFSVEEMKDPATVLYALAYLKIAKQSGNDYFFAMLEDMRFNRDRHIKFINEQLERSRQLLKGFSYRPLCMWKHLEEVLEDEHAIVIANPPTYKSGFEKFYDTGGNITWKEPEYAIFEPIRGREELFQKFENAKALLLCYEETEPKDTVGSPVFARYGVRTGVNVYLTSNRPEEAAQLAEGKKISRPAEKDLLPINAPIMPRDYEISESSTIKTLRVTAKEAAYYRSLWTHNFVGSKSKINMVLFVDGMIAGVFGYDSAGLTMGAFGKQVGNAMFLMYGVTVPHLKYRLNRLVTMIAQTRSLVLEVCDDIEKEKVKTLKTVQMTKYPEAKEMRGLMKLILRNRDPVKGYRLTYESELKDWTYPEALKEWLRREVQWRKARMESK